MKTILALIFLLFSFFNGFAQIKVPTYIFGMISHKCGEGIPSYGGTGFFQFFADSTFTLTSYRVVSKYFYRAEKTERKGKYIKLADTLFLRDSASIGYPFIKDTIHYAALGKDEDLQLYPAKIILAKDKDTYIIKATYLSYLNIPRELKSLDFLCVINLQMDYARSLMERLW